MTKKACIAWKGFNDPTFYHDNGPEMKPNQQNPLEFSKLQKIIRYGTKRPLITNKTLICA